MATVTYSYREVRQWARVCRLNKTKFAEIFEETLKQNSPDSETSNTFRVRHIIWQHKGHYAGKWMKVSSLVFSLVFFLVFSVVFSVRVWSEYCHFFQQLHLCCLFDCFVCLIFLHKLLQIALSYIDHALV